MYIEQQTDQQKIKESDSVDLSKRNRTVDILKGIGIILMLIGHTVSNTGDKHWISFICLFHMPLFFIASGYTYKEKYSDNAKSVLGFIVKKIKSLYLPFVIYSVIYILLHNLFIEINIYTADDAITVYGFETVSYYAVKDIIKNILKAICFYHSEQMSGAFWFLQVLFFSSSLYCCFGFLYNLIKKRYKFISRTLFQGIISIILLAVGFILYKIDFNFYRVGSICSVYILLYIGNLLNSKQLMDRIPYWSIIIAFCIIEVLNILPFSISLGSNKITDPIGYLLVSFAGWLLVYKLSEIIDRRIEIVAKLLSMVGRHTLTIMALHFLCFKLINVICVYVYEYPIYCIAAFPVLRQTGAWWILYCIVGVAIPVVISILYAKLKSVIKKHIVKIRK